MVRLPVYANVTLFLFSCIYVVRLLSFVSAGQIGSKRRHRTNGPLMVVETNGNKKRSYSLSNMKPTV